MGEDTPLRVCHVSESADGSALQVRNALRNLDVEHSGPCAVDIAFEMLRDGETDLVSMSGITAFSTGFDGFEFPSEFEIAAVLARREPTFVLVSPDKPEYLPKRAVVLVPNPLLARQLRRSRPDLEIKTEPSNLSDLFYSDSNPEEVISKTTRLESGEIDGFVLERAVWDRATLKTRRHTLGVNLEGDQDRHRFIPSPLRGFSLLISRTHFPSSLIPEVDDDQAREVWKTESALTRRMLFLGGLVGIFVQVRRSNTILRTAADSDALFAEWWHDSTTTRPTHMLEMLAEVLDARGRVTVSLEKRYPLEEAHRATEVFMREWNAILDLAMSEHRADLRHGDAAPAMLRLEEE